MAVLPSWQAYSYMSYLGSSCHGNSTDQGRVRIVGSSTVILYSTVSGPVRVKRSTMRMFSDVGFNAGEPGTPELVIAGLPLKFRVSTTSVLPSQCPLDSPRYCLIVGSRAGRPSVGMMRASCA